MYNYEKCENLMGALTQYQSNVRQIMLTIDKDDIRRELFINDEEFLDYLTGRLKDVDSAADKEIQ